MNFQIPKHLRLVIVAAMLLVLLGGCALIVDNTTGPEGTLSSTTASGTTAPTTTVPETTMPPTTVPETTVLPTTVPETTVPPTTVPETTVPPTTVPETMVPPTTVPETTVPPTTVPETTIPPTTVPEATEPVPPLPDLSAANAFVYDTRTGEYLYLSCDQYTKIYPASITKLFTTYVAMQYLSPDTLITVGEERSMVIWDASVAGLNQGDTLTAEALAKCALLVSGCEASYTLAAAAGRAILQAPNAPTDVAIQTFMVQVNQSAALLGMVNTHFVTPDGNHAKDHYVSMSAFVTIAKCCLEDPLISEIVSTYLDTVSVTNANGKTRNLTLRNSNENINPNKPDHYRPETVGLKTGYTSKAGACLLSAFAVEDGYLIVGIFGCPNYSSRYEDAIALLRYFTES